MPYDQWQADGGTPLRAPRMMLFRRGDEVERRIDREWFPARVTDAYCEEDEVFYDIAYADDGGNTEDEVPEEELRGRNPDATPLRPRQFSSPEKSPLESLGDSPTAEPVRCQRGIHSSAGVEGGARPVHESARIERFRDRRRETGF